MLLRRSLIYLALAAIAAALAVYNIYLWQLQSEKKQRIEGLSSQITLHQLENQNLIERNDALGVDVETLRSPDSFYAYEEKAREEYGMIGKNETFFVLPKKEIAEIADVPGLNDPTQPLPEPSLARHNNAFRQDVAEENPSTEAELSTQVQPIAVSPVPLQLESLQ